MGHTCELWKQIREMCKFSEWHSANCCRDIYQKGPFKLVMVRIIGSFSVCSKSRINIDSSLPCSWACHHRTTWRRTQRCTSVYRCCQDLFGEICWLIFLWSLSLLFSVPKFWLRSLFLWMFFVQRQGFVHNPFIVECLLFLLGFFVCT